MGPAAGKSKKSDELQKLANDLQAKADAEREAAENFANQSDSYFEDGDVSSAANAYADAWESSWNAASDQWDANFYDSAAAILRALGL